MARMMASIWAVSRVSMAKSIKVCRAWDRGEGPLVFHFHHVAPMFGDQGGKPGQLPGAVGRRDAKPGQPALMNQIAHEDGGEQSADRCFLQRESIPPFSPRNRSRFSKRAARAPRPRLPPRFFNHEAEADRLFDAGSRTTITSSTRAPTISRVRVPGSLTAMPSAMVPSSAGGASSWNSPAMAGNASLCTPMTWTSGASALTAAATPLMSPPRPPGR